MGWCTCVVGGDLAGRDVVPGEDWIGSTRSATVITRDKKDGWSVSDAFILTTLHPNFPPSHQRSASERDTYDKPFSRSKASPAVMF